MGWMHGTFSWKSSWPALILAASILSSCFLLTQAQDIIPVTLEPSQQIEEQDVTLTPGGSPNFVSCSWYRKAVNEKTQILTYFLPPNPVQQNYPSFTGRETAGPGCTLHIRNLLLNDTGDYVVMKYARTATERGQAHIEVLEILTKPTMSAFPNPYPVEFIDSLHLTCETSSGYAEIRWFKNGSPLGKSVHVALSGDNRTLSIPSVTRYDCGQYQCEVSNLVSTATSDVTYVSVTYGPDPPIIHEVFYKERSKLHLSCRADAFPAASYVWFLNGKLLPDKPSSLIRDLAPEHSGNYTCQAENRLSRQKKNTTLKIEVVGRWTSV